MRILMISDGVPYPALSGGSTRTYQLLRRIANQHPVWLATLAEGPENAMGLNHLRQLCCGVEIAYRQRRHPLAHLPGLLAYALAGKPLELRFAYSSELAHKVKQLALAIHFDIVHIEHSHMALYVEALPADLHCKRILAFQNIAFDQYARMSRLAQDPVSKIRMLLYSFMMRRWEPRYAERFDRCITVSNVDRCTLLAANPRLRVDVVPNGVDTKACQPLPPVGALPALLFVGKMNYPACADAVTYFCREILPSIRRVFGNIEMWIVGIDPPLEVRRLDGDGVHVTGRVDDVVPYYHRSSVCVVPLRAGGGTRLKILEAMALGRPVVSTSIGSEGLDVANGENILLADSPEQFVSQVVRLLTDRDLYQRVTTNARHFVVTRYDWDMIAARLMRIYAEGGAIRDAVCPGTYEQIDSQEGRSD